MRRCFGLSRARYPLSRDRRRLLLDVDRVVNAPVLRCTLDRITARRIDVAQRNGVTTVALTPKQRQVFDLVAKDIPVPEIARRLKISTSGVYAHLRNIKAAGVDLPASAATEPAAPSLAMTVHSIADPTEAVKQAIAAGRRRSAEIDSEVSALNASIEALANEKAALEARLAQFETALATLAENPSVAA